MDSTPPCPNTATVRRNPHRRARPTPATSALKPPNLSSQQIPNFPIEEILSIKFHNSQNPKCKTPKFQNPLQQNPKFENPLLENSKSQTLLFENPIKNPKFDNPLIENAKLENSLLENPKLGSPKFETLRVFLRIKPMIVKKLVKCDKKNVWPRKNEIRPKMKRGKGGICVSINDDHSVTLCPPKGLQEAKRAKSEVFEGFSHVFSDDSSQVEVFDKMVKPLVDEFIRGRSGTLVALGPSGSGKTHTVFGSPRDPGMVPLALSRIFSENATNYNQSSRQFYLSMFEISEKGKTERLCDLLQDGGDLCLQQSAIRGLQEVLISDVQQAECLIARGMLKRATAMTNSNSQSSRSQCVINIHTVENKINEEANLELNGAVLTIVDLAGAEREKKTGNQGVRLLESNFINITSMVFGLCLRSLLEHQKNPKRPLQKHFQSSLLTRYLREYLEGKKRMALILTVKSGDEDYVDSSLLLRQASPYTKIKFDNAEDAANMLCTKRQKQSMPRIEPAKRMKFCPEGRGNNCGTGVRDQLHDKESKKAREIAPQPPLDHAESTSECVYLEKISTGSAKQERSYMIMQNFAKAFWNVLKEYKTNLEVAENEIQNLTESLAEEKARSSKLEIELKVLKGSLLYGEEISLAKEDRFSADRSAEQVGHQGQSCEVAENQIQHLREFLADENACLSELEGNLSCSKEISSAKEDSFSADKSAERVGCHGQSCQMANNQIQHLREVLADEDATHSVLEINLTCSNEISPIKEDRFSDNRTEEQVRSQQSDNVHDSNSCNASSLAAVNSKSHGQGCQECGEFLGNVDCTESLTKLTVGKDDSQFKDSGHQKPFESFPELLTITKESSPEPLTSTKDNFCQSAKSNQMRCDEHKVTSNSPLVGHQKTLIRSSKPLIIAKVSSPEPLTITKERSPEPLTEPKENCCHSAENHQKCGEEYKVTFDLPLAGHQKTIISSTGPLDMIQESSLEPLTKEKNKIRGEKSKKQSLRSMKPHEAEACPDSDVYNGQKIAKKSRPLNPSNVEKPKRRLAPASSILLKDIGGFVFDDENEKPKGFEAVKKSAPNERIITQGSLSLLHLLNSEFHS